MKNLDLEFIERLKSTMARNNLTQKDLTKYLGVPQSTVSNWLSGKRAPGHAAIRLLEVLSYIETFAPGIHESLIER